MSYVISNLELFDPSLSGSEASVVSHRLDSGVAVAYDAVRACVSGRHPRTSTLVDTCIPANIRKRRCGSIFFLSNAFYFLAQPAPAARN